MTNCLWGGGTRKLLSDLSNGSLSVTELIADSHARVASQNSKTKAFYEVYYSEKPFPVNTDSNLMGLPVAVKDFIFTKGQICSAGSAMLEDFKAPYSATCWERLRSGGATLFGRTSMDEFGMGSSNENSFKGAVKNPWDLTCTPGGSSGGSAAAVAGGIVPFALGTDTGGSVRQPASFCGVTGLKPSYGRVSRFGVISFASSLDQVGAFALDAYGCAKILENISGVDLRDPTSSREASFALNEPGQDPIAKKKIAIPSFVDGIALDPEVKKSFKEFKSYLISRGAVVETVEMPHLELSLPVYYLICTSEASSNLSRYDGVHLGNVGDKNLSLNKVIAAARSKGFGPEVKRRILLGAFALSAGYRDAYFNKAAQVRRLIKESFENTFKSYDFILSPTSPEQAFKLGAKQKDPLKMYNSDLLTIPSSLAGLPAISFPVPSEGLPVGMQLTAPYFKEVDLLNFVDAYQLANDGYLPRVSESPELTGGLNE